MGEKVTRDYNNYVFVLITFNNLTLLLQVMVEVANGFKIGSVKFIGETEFAGGEWIGVALERPFGECCHGYAVFWEWFCVSMVIS